MKVFIGLIFCSWTLSFVCPFYISLLCVAWHTTCVGIFWLKRKAVLLYKLPDIFCPSRPWGIVFFLEFSLLLSRLTNQHSVCEDVGSIPGFTPWVKNLMLPQLWCRLVAAALIHPLAWELPYAADVTLKRKKKINICYQHPLIAAWTD